MCVCVVGRITDEQRLQFPNERRRRKQKKKFFFVCFSRSFFFKKFFFGGGLEKMSRMEFDGVEKNNLVDVEIAKKGKGLRMCCVAEGNKEILAEKSRDVNARVSIEKENN
jgi:hypothetical protein